MVRIEDDFYINSGNNSIRNDNMKIQCFCKRDIVIVNNDKRGINYYFILM